LLSSLTAFRDSFWPKGIYCAVWPIRTVDQQEQKKKDVKKKLLSLAKQFGGVIGKNNTTTGATRLFDVFQSRRLNQHLLYTIIDEL
jgi:sorting nexin-25